MSKRVLIGNRMDEKDEQELGALAEQVIEVLDNLHKIRELVSELESRSSILLRKLLRRNADQG